MSHKVATAYHALHFRYWPPDFSRGPHHQKYVQRIRLTNFGAPPSCNGLETQCNWSASATDCVRPLWPNADVTMRNWMSACERNSDFGPAGGSHPFFGNIPVLRRRRLEMRFDLHCAVWAAAWSLRPRIQGKCGEILPTFQKAFFNRECASSNPPRSANHSINLR